MTEAQAAFHVDGTWTFANPVRVHFGRGVRGRLDAALAGRRCLIVTTQRGRGQLSSDPQLGSLATAAGNAWTRPVTPNPRLTDLEAEIDRVRGQAFEAVLAFGGGSALDTGKVLAVALAAGVAGDGLPDLLGGAALPQDLEPPPVHAVPTTSGTGSEVTPFATVWDDREHTKRSLSGAAVLPSAAYVDPALSDSAPQEVTLSTGLDAINQAAESIWNRNATPVTLELAARALQLGLPALPALMDDLAQEGARDAMAEASLLAGLAISQTRTALCHSMSYPITAHFGVPHGLACAFTMPAVLRLNVSADDGRFGVLAHRLLGAGSSVEDLLHAFEALHRRLDVRRRTRDHLSDLPSLQALAGQMHTPGRADNNLVEVGPAEIRALIAAAW